ncbi:NAD(P)/FAD-dependent oxidoreductase [Steroidobacter flavus]|uniref:NAD(P)/FAD-dependent oxidoreductase n=1 Tax=Steroidobacter flavus TaxID=1842136 RepID=A0ABV8T2V7_9GAMM
MPERIVILGAGHAAAQAIDTLRRRGHRGSIVLVGDEPHLPYQRPPLSKKYLAGTHERSRLLIRQARYYSERAIETRLGRRALQIDRRTQRARLDDGSDLAYDALLIATGSRARALTVPGADLDGVRYLRTMADVDSLRTGMESARRIVIIGGGYIGLEVAATCRQRGLAVTVLETQDRVMKRVVSEETSAAFTAEHLRNGVNIICGAGSLEIASHAGTQQVRAVVCDGCEHEADIVLIGVGAAAAQELACDAGLECDNGIVVDLHGRTSDASIYAAGDCTSHPSARYGGYVRLESVDNAFEQATTAALNMLGEPAEHDSVPWFWSEQFDLKLTITGLASGHDTVVVRGDPTSRCFSVCYLRGNELLAVESVGNSKDAIAARRLIAARSHLEPHHLANPACGLDRLPANSRPAN